MSKTLPVFVVLYYYTKYILTHVWSIVDQNNFFDQMGWTSVHDRMNCSEQCRPCLIMKAYNHTSCGEFWQKTIGSLAPVLKELEFYVKPTVKFFFLKKREIIIVWTFKIYSFKIQIFLWIELIRNITLRNALNIMHTQYGPETSIINVEPLFGSYN